MEPNTRPPTMHDFWMQQAAWSVATFGTSEERGPIGPLKHLAKEVQECIAKPTDLEEYADLLFLAFDATRRAGFTYDDLRDAAFRKLAKNKARVWPKPTAGDQPIEHDRSYDKVTKTAQEEATPEQLEAYAKQRISI
jgi:hypothetical protein